MAKLQCHGTSHTHGLCAGSGAVVAEINLEETPNSGMMDIVLLGKSGEILPRVLEHWT